MIDWQALIDNTQGLMSAQECEELARWASVAPDGIALEVGHYTGLSTCVLLASLPSEREFITIDLRWEMLWTAEVFDKHVERFVGDRRMRTLIESFVTGIPRIDTQIGFAFYDADHSREAVVKFWNAIRVRLAPRSTLVYDDADWESQALLGDLARRDGFVATPHKAWTRHITKDRHPSGQAMLDTGKRHPDTFTLEVMTRG